MTNVTFQDAQSKQQIQVQEVFLTSKVIPQFAVRKFLTQGWRIEEADAKEKVYFILQMCQCFSGATYWQQHQASEQSKLSAQSSACEGRSQMSQRKECLDGIGFQVDPTDTLSAGCHSGHHL